MFARLRSSWPVLGAFLLVLGVSGTYSLLLCALLWWVGLPWWIGLIPFGFSLVGAEALHVLRDNEPPTKDTFVIARDDDSRVHAVLDRLCALTGLDRPVLRLYGAEGPNAVAHVPDRGPATVYVTADLLEQLDNQQLEAVLAHELAHLSHRDQRVISFAEGMSRWMLNLPISAVNLMYRVNEALWVLSLRAGTDWDPLFDAVEEVAEKRERIRRAEPLPLLLRPLALVVVLLGRGLIIIAALAVLPATLAGVLLFILTALPSNIVVLRLVRRRELAADRAAAELTGAPTVLASVLTSMTAAIPVSQPKGLSSLAAMDALSILPHTHPQPRETGAEDGFWRKSIALCRRAFSTHPPVAARVDALRDLASRRLTG
ncbi:M48 family metalloprotease [Nocardiopsis sp. Huas11]|uniref:M48 family metalloprotease n=1 Tax=Nocardiopsis sp. Huas11 TaxID=2183912 RepID=UPI0013159209|nr:M48 family metalloprotease [Nocardiopsis sp. Huas11]